MDSNFIIGLIAAFIPVLVVFYSMDARIYRNLNSSGYTFLLLVVVGNMVITFLRWKNPYGEDASYYLIGNVLCFAIGIAISYKSKYRTQPPTNSGENHE